MSDSTLSLQDILVVKDMVARIGEGDIRNLIGLLG